MLPDMEGFVLQTVAIMLFAYLAGSIPAGLIFTRIMNLPDPRTIGSGNMGTTNVLRTGSRLAAGLTLLVDAGKGTVAVAVALALFGVDGGWVAGPAVFLGHLFPVWTGFRGGKGVATFLGVALAYDVVTCAAACATWVLCAAILRYSSLSALVASVVAPIVAYHAVGAETAIILSCMSIVLWIRHAANIRRLWTGEEPRIGEKS